MDNEKVTAIASIAATLMTLEQTDGWMPRSMLYLALGSSLERATRVEQICQKAGYIEVTPTVIKLTEDGRAVARDLASVR